MGEVRASVPSDDDGGGRRDPWDGRGDDDDDDRMKVHRREWLEVKR